MTAKKVELLAREIQEVSREQTQFFPFKHAHSMRDVLRKRRERDREGKKKVWCTMEFLVEIPLRVEIFYSQLRVQTRELIVSSNKLNRNATPDFSNLLVSFCNRTPFILFVLESVTLALKVQFCLPLVCNVFLPFSEFSRI